MGTDSLYELLVYADNHDPIYFFPNADLSIYFPDDERRDVLGVTGYSLNTLVQGLESGGVESDRVAFTDNTAQKYLSHLKETGFEDRLHHAQLMSRDRLVAFADAGYTTVDDFLGSADPIDIGKDTGVDRDIITDIVGNFLDGFSTASSLGDTGPLADLTPQDSFDGWTLVTKSPHMIRWVSPGRFNLTIKPSPNGSVTVECNVPENQSAWYRKGYSIETSVEQAATPEDALEQAHSWLKKNQINYDENLSEYPQIGPSTKDYLALKYGVTTVDALETFSEDHPDTFSEIFGSGDDLKSSIDG